MIVGARRSAALGVVLGAAVCLGCGDSRASQRSTPSVAVVLDRQPNAVNVRGLDRATLRRLDRLAPNDTVWQRMVAVYVAGGSADTTAGSAQSSTPPVIGRYAVANDGIRFEPRFPFAEGVAYRVEVDTAALALGDRSRTPGDERPSQLTHRFVIPAVTRVRTTRITGVYPSLERLPSNLLRWYVETSAPMEVGNALTHVHLMDESGREVRSAFLSLDQELWDPTQRRLTLLFDPGRVKRGVRTNLESGAPLVAGRRYTLVIDAEWTDGAGARLASGYRRAFDAIDADRRSPDPDRWRLTIPGAGTRVPLRVAFGEALDHALATRMLAVADGNGTAVPGIVALAANDSVWTFTPERDWLAGDYVLRVGGALEDLAGNNVVRVFDVDRRVDSAGVDREVSGAIRRVRFRISAAK